MQRRHKSGTIHATYFEMNEIVIPNLLKNESGNGDDFILLGDIFRRIAWPNTPNTGTII